MQITARRRQYVAVKELSKKNKELNIIKRGIPAESALPRSVGHLPHLPVADGARLGGERAGDGID